LDILISTIYEGKAVVQAVKLFSPEKIYFIVDDPINNTRKLPIEMIKDIFPDIDIINKTVKTYDIVDIANKTIEIIKEEKNNNIKIHISEARKTMGLGLLFGAYVLKDYVDSAYYIIEETNEPLKLPLIELNVSKKKKEILNLISSGINSSQKLSEELKIKTSTLYVHLKELRDNGFITKDTTLTNMGKIVMLI
jgi:CRISPR locus-related DNA-binding protein